MDSTAEFGDAELTDAISEAMVQLHADYYDHDRTTATTYITDDVVVCVMEDILSTGESSRSRWRQSRRDRWEGHVQTDKRMDSQAG